MMRGSRDRARRARTRMWRSSPRCRVSYGSRRARASRRARPVIVGARARAAGASARAPRSGVRPWARARAGSRRAWRRDRGRCKEPHRDDSVEASVLCWQRLGRPIDDVDRDGDSASALGGDGPCRRVGFDRDELRHGRRVVLERAPVAAAELEHTSAQASQQPAPELTRDWVGPLPLPVLQVGGKARLLRAVQPRTGLPSLASRLGHPSRIRTRPLVIIACLCAVSSSSPWPT